LRFERGQITGMAEEEANEQTWLKGNRASLATKAKSVNPVSPRPPDTKDAPSWLFEEHDRGMSTTNFPAELSPTAAAGEAPPLIKRKAPAAVHIADDDDAEDDSDTCCCCCPSNPMLFGFQCFHFIAGLAGLLALAANIYIFTLPNLYPKDEIMRCYALIFCVLVVIIEFDWRFVVNKIRFVDWWALRGFFYTLVGFMTCKIVVFQQLCTAYLSAGMCTVVGITDTTVEVSSAPQEIAGMVLAAVGLGYIVMVRTNIVWRLFQAPFAYKLRKFPYISQRRARFA
jgi:uncharacterized membrane protein HdeD (DUF308 family)